MKLGERIKYLRNILGISQQELADKSNLTHAAISQYESNKRLPDLKSFVKICKSFGIKTDKMLEEIDLS